MTDKDSPIPLKLVKLLLSIFKLVIISLISISSLIGINFALGYTLHESGFLSKVGATMVERRSAAMDASPHLSKMFEDFVLENLNDAVHAAFGNQVENTNSEFLNVKDAVRSSYRQRRNTQQPPIKVFFFGGSTMFGYGQRDEHTIASYVAKLAENDGINIVVKNYGQLAWVRWQQIALLNFLVSRNENPDLVVFYDGFNDVFTNVRKYLEHAPPSILPGVFSEPNPPNLFQFSAFHQAAGLLAHYRFVTSEPSEIKTDSDGRFFIKGLSDTQKEDLKRVAAKTVHAYHKDVTLLKNLSNNYNFTFRAFWQPFLLNKKIVKGETLNSLFAGKEDKAKHLAYTARLVAKDLDPTLVTSIASALDIADPVMIDVCHTNELGAREVGKAIYEQIKSDLALIKDKKI